MQDRQVGWAGRDLHPGGERTVLAAVGAPTALPTWLQSLELLPAVAGGSDGEATNGPDSWSPNAYRPGAPRGATTVGDINSRRSGAVAKAVRGGMGSAARAPAPCGKTACHRTSRQGTAAVGATPSAIPEGVKGLGSAHPQIHT